MSKFETEAEGQKRFFYHVCPACGGTTHEDNMYCEKCGKRIRSPGGVGKSCSSTVDPQVRRNNLDHPDGCPKCKSGCTFCFSFGHPAPHPKAHCEYCGTLKKSCCARARNLPTISEALDGVSLADIIRRRVANCKIITEEWDKMYSQAVRECWSNTRGSVELFEKREAG